MQREFLRLSTGSILAGFVGSGFLAYERWILEGSDRFHFGSFSWVWPLGM